ncbi:MAG: cyclase family protein, partial [Verrucomicrobiota bacterium]|nr:cyclase family protein [Verrucomicrobiota bacterium]
SKLFATGARREITVTDLASHESAIAGAGRVLLKTNCWPDSTVFPDWIPVLAAHAVEWLREERVQLLGVDVPSVDPIDAKDLANHRALAAANIAIIESLDLTNVDVGVYQFAGLPLKISGGDGAPVRAVLWRD